MEVPREVDQVPLGPISVQSKHGGRNSGVVPTRPTWQNPGGVDCAEVWSVRGAWAGQCGGTGWTGGTQVGGGFRQGSFKWGGQPKGGPRQGDPR